MTDSWWINRQCIQALPSVASLNPVMLGIGLEPRLKVGNSTQVSLKDGRNPVTQVIVAASIGSH